MTFTPPAPPSALSLNVDEALDGIRTSTPSESASQRSSPFRKVWELYLPIVISLEQKKNAILWEIQRFKEQLHCMKNSQIGRLKSQM